MKKFSVHPLSFIVWIWLFFVFGFLSALSYLLAVLIHEWGHFIFAKKLGYKLSRFSISPYGFSLSYLNQDFNYKDEIKIAFAGPVLNILTSLAVVGVWWLVPEIYFYTQTFVVANIALALFNLLPAYPLDGGRIFIDVASCFFSTRTAKKLTQIFNIVLTIIFFILFVAFVFINFNPTYLLFACFLFVGAMDLGFESKYEKINIFAKIEKNFVKPEIYCVYPDVCLSELLEKIQSSKICVFYLILNSGKIVIFSEKLVLKLLKKYNFNEKLEKIIKKI